MALKQVAQHVQSILNMTNDCAEGVLVMRSELQQVQSATEDAIQ